MLDETPASADDGVEATPTLDELAEMARAQIAAIDVMYKIDRGVGGLPEEHFEAYRAWQNASEGSYSHADTVLRLIGMIQVTPPADNVREALARIIDPEAWRDVQPHSQAFHDDADAQAKYEGFFWEGVRRRRAPSLVAADRILTAAAFDVRPRS